MPVDKVRVRISMEDLWMCGKGHAQRTVRTSWAGGKYERVDYGVRHQFLYEEL